MVTYAFHQHIIERNWEAVENDLRLSSGQDMVKERYGNNRSLPLHMAIQKQAPEGLILGLLRIYPQAAHIKTKNGDLPMHVCCKFGSTPTVVEALLLEFPEAITIKTTCKIGSIGFVSAKEIAQRNPVLSRQFKSLLEKPVSHWISLATHEKVMHQKSFDATLGSMKAELKRTKQNEHMLLDRLAQLEERLLSVERKATMAHQNDGRDRNKRNVLKYNRNFSRASTDDTSDSEQHTRTNTRRRGSCGSLTSRSERPQGEDVHKPTRRRGSIGRIASAFQRIRRSSMGRKSEEDAREKAREGMSGGAAAVAGYVTEALNPF